MTTSAKYRLFTAFAVILLAVLPAAALAAPELTASADKTSVTEGDTVTVTVTLSGKKLSAVEGEFTYDPSLLSFAEGDGGVSDGRIAMVSAEKDGSSSLSVRITFTAAGAGDAKIDFSIINALNYSGEEQGTANASVTVSIAAAPVTAAAPDADLTAEGIPAEGMTDDAGQQLYIWTSLENVTIPSKYSETTVDYKGQQVPAVEVTDSDAPTLLYLSNANGENGSYYIYDAETGTMYKYKTISSSSRSYILLEPDGSVPLPEGFTETTITINDVQVKAWAGEDAQGAVYLIYGRNPDGEVGYYVYSDADKSIIRYSVMPARPVDPELPAEAEATPAPEQTAEQAKSGGISPIIFYAVCAAAGILLIALIVTIAAHAREEKQRRERLAKRRAQREKAKADAAEISE